MATNMEIDEVVKVVDLLVTLASPDKAKARLAELQAALEELKVANGVHDTVEKAQKALEAVDQHSAAEDVRLAKKEEALDARERDFESKAAGVRADLEQRRTDAAKVADLQAERQKNLDERAALAANREATIEEKMDQLTRWAANLAEQSDVLKVKSEQLKALLG